MSWFSFRPYVPVAERRRKAEREMAKLAQKGKVIKPVQLEGRTIARTFWGKAWCDNLESYMDYANRLPRGRKYVRNGSVVHLDILPGTVEATVSGSELYRITVSITAAARAKWKRLCRECAGGIGSLIELLQGRFADNVMAILTRQDTGLFPSPAEIRLSCSCPDWATMCKHVAAVLYGVGARLDQSPELLFTLRSVQPEDLITQVATAGDLAGKTATAGPELAESDISAVFGIELDTQTATPTAPSTVITAAPKPTKSPRKIRKRAAPAKPTRAGRRTARRPAAKRVRRTRSLTDA